ncbi:hypothetical protein A2U01_0090906, partial [Trifolium medium]|nr:hypothetical protein [Trifolium medium]
MSPTFTTPGQPSPSLTEVASMTTPCFALVPACAVLSSSPLWTAGLK